MILTGPITSQTSSSHDRECPQQRGIRRIAKGEFMRIDFPEAIIQREFKIFIHRPIKGSSK